MSWADEPFPRLDSVRSFLSPEERAQLLESENRALREKLSVAEEAIGLLQMKLVGYEAEGAVQHARALEPAAWQALQMALDERLQALQDAQSSLLTLFRREHDRLAQEVSAELARFMATTLVECERILIDAFSRAPQLLLRGFAENNPHALAEAQQLVRDAQARAAQLRRSAHAALDERVRTLQESVTNLLSLFQREVDSLVREVRDEVRIAQVGAPPAPAMLTQGPTNHPAPSPGSQDSAEGDRRPEAGNPGRDERSSLTEQPSPDERPPRTPLPAVERFAGRPPPPPAPSRGEGPSSTAAPASSSFSVRPGTSAGSDRGFPREPRLPAEPSPPEPSPSAPGPIPPRPEPPRASREPDYRPGTVQQIVLPPLDATVPEEEPPAPAAAQPAMPLPERMRAPMGPALAAEARRNTWNLQQARLVVSPFPNFTVLIRFDEVLKRIGSIRRLRSRSFRAGRLEVTLEYDPDQPLVEALLAQQDVPLELVSSGDDTFVFRLLESSGGR
jgi:hypothetical protein